MPERLRIAYVYSRFSRGGSLGARFVDWGERLARDEDVTAVCSAVSRDPTEAPLRFETVEPLVVGRGRLDYALERASFAFRASRLLRRSRSRFDVIHVLGTAAATADLVSVTEVRPAGLRHYFETIEPRARIRRRLAPVLRPEGGVVIAVERRLFRPPFPYCLAESDAVAAALRTHYAVPEDAVEVLPPALDTRLFRHDASARASVRRELAFPDDRLAVLFVGDDFERKGLRRAIVALSRMQSDAELWVAGNGRVDAYRELAGSLGVGRSVRFLGRLPRSEVARFYSACDAVLLPSSLDVWGQPAIEGMAAGRVVVVSEFAGAHVAIRDGVDGFVLEGSGTPEQIARVLDTAAEPEIRRTVGRKAVEAAAPFDQRALYGRLRAAHHKALERRLRHEAPGRRPPGRRGTAAKTTA